VQALHKSYMGIVKLGATTPTCDSEMDEENIKDVSGITDEQIRSAVDTFIGKIEQVAICSINQIPICINSEVLLIKN